MIHTHDLNTWSHDPHIWSHDLNTWSHDPHKHIVVTTLNPDSYSFPLQLESRGLNSAALCLGGQSPLLLAPLH